MKMHSIIRGFFCLVVLVVSFGCNDAQPETVVAVEDTSVDTDADVVEFGELDFDELFPEDSVKGDDNLKLLVKKDVVTQVEDGQAWLVPFAYRSTVWHGNPWDHPSVLYIPTELSAERAGLVALVQQSTDDLDPSAEQDARFGVQTAIELGIPVAVIAKGPHPTLFSEVESATLSQNHPECFEAFLVENNLDNCSRKLTWMDGQDYMPWALEVPLAKVYTRAITALQAIPEAMVELGLEGVPSYTVEEVVVGAAGKRARALWLAAKVDDRIAGLWLAAADVANLGAFYDNLSEVWSGEFPMEAPSVVKAFLKTSFGPVWRSLVDPYGYMDELEDLELSLVRGSNDGTSPLGSYALYEDALPPHDWTIIPNSGFGMGTDSHLASWRSFLARVGAGKGPGELDVSYSADGSDVIVEVTTPPLQEDPFEATVWRSKSQVIQDDMDLRDTVWEALPLELMDTDGNGRRTYQANVSDPGLDSWGLYITLEYAGSAGQTVVRSSAPWLSWQE